MGVGAGWRAESANMAGLDVAIRFEPGTGGTGGDWHNTAVRPDGSLVVVLGDVVGHGVEAGAAMGQLRHIVADLLRGGTPLHRIFTTTTTTTTTTTSKLVDLDNTVLATAVLLHADARRRRLGYQNAGHPWPLIRDPTGRVARLDGSRHPPIGVRADSEPLTYVDLPPGAVVLAYTDGLVERADASIVDRIDRLADILAKIDCQDDVGEILRHIVATARRPDEHGEPLDDDVAAVLIRS